VYAPLKPVLQTTSVIWIKVDGVEPA